MTLSSVKLHWVLSYLGRWHAWPDGGRNTLCGRLNVEHLRQHAVTKISQTAPELGSQESWCAFCEKKAGLKTPAIHSDPTVAPWLAVLRIQMHHRRIKVADRALVQLAELLAQIGLPGTFEGIAVWEDVSGLLLKPTWNTKKIPSLPHLKSALALLPNTGALLRVTSAIRIWRDTTGRTLSTENFNPPRVIETILQLPSHPTPYIRHLHTRGLTHFAAVFHPNTLERAKKDPALRGLFAGSSEYWNATADQLNIVTD